jgi:DNA helicase-2/ATP-dependent DNA helicase PcrA
MFMLELDSTQRRAIESGSKTVVVAGPPGSGKTRCIAGRFEHLIKQHKVPLSSILVLTFSAAPVTYLRRTIESIIGGSYTELWIHTHHSFAGHLLSLHAMTPGGTGKNTSAAPLQITPFRAYLIAKELLRSELKNLKSNLKELALKDGLAREIADFFGLLTQHLIMPGQFAEMARNLSPRIKDLSRLYSAYSDYIAKKNWVCPGDSIVRAIETMRADPVFAEELQGKFKHILVDEFQEIDPAQLHLIELLASEETSLFLTGDENQRIYRFRGSLTDQIYRILRRRPAAESIQLNMSYRLPPEILKASKNLIAHNRESIKDDFSPISEKEIKILSYTDAIEQAYDVARNIKRRVLDGAEGGQRTDYSDFAIVCRSTSRSGPALEEAFSFYDVPYILYNSTSFYRHPMTRCVAAFVRLLIDPSDDSSLMRVLSIPYFGLDAIALKRIVSEWPRFRGENLFQMLHRAVEKGAAGEVETAAALKRFFDYFDDTRKRAGETSSPSNLIHSIMQDLFFGEILNKTDMATGVRDARNLKLLYEVMCDIEGVFAGMRNRYTLADLVEHMEHAFAHFSSQQENDPTDEPVEGVRIMTVHQAKGMEFPFVYHVDATDEYFPQLRRSMTLLDGRSTRRMKESLAARQQNDDPGSFVPELSLSVDEQLREERHLAYVALTRAQKKLVVCYTQESNLSESVQPSPFIREFLGKDVNAEPKPAIASSTNPVEALPQLQVALNRQEVESALRSCLDEDLLDNNNRQSISARLEALGLDSHFICDKSPFEPEAERAIDLSGHIYSASQLNTYLTCPRMFYYDRLLRVGPERPEDFGLGQLIHNTLEHFHKDIRSFEEAPRMLHAKIEQSFQDVWNGSGRDNAREVFREKYSAILQQAAIEQKALKILRRYIDTETEGIPGREVVACEEKVEFKVGSFDFVARIDRIDCVSRGHLIIDYKTSSSPVMKPITIKKKFVNFDDVAEFKPKDFQLPLYVMAARAAGYNPVELVYYWLSQEDSGGMFKISSLCLGNGNDDLLSEAEIAAAEENIIFVAERIAAGDFPPDPVVPYECTRCAFDSVCAYGEEEPNDA